MGRKKTKKKRNYRPANLQGEITLEGAVGQASARETVDVRSDRRDRGGTQDGTVHNDDEFPSLQRSQTKSTAANLQQDDSVVNTEITLEGAVSQASARETVDVNSDRRDRGGTQDGIVHSEDEFPSFQRSQTKTTDDNRDLVLGNVTSLQSVANIYAEGVQMGHNNTMQVTNEGEHIHHTTNVGGDGSVNVFGGEFNVPRISIESKAGTHCQESVNGTQSISAETSVQVIQNVTAKNVAITQNVCKVEPKRNLFELHPQTTRKQFDKFRQIVNGFRDGHYLLITDKTEHVKNIDALGRAPWTVVFDFDKCSRRCGLLSHVQQIIEYQRSLNLYTWQERYNVTDQSTSWVLMNGNDQVQESVIDGKLKGWRQKVRKSLEANISNLEKFGDGCTQYTIVVIWPQEEKHVHQVIHLLTKLSDDLPASVVIVHDSNNTSEESSDVLKGHLKTEEHVDCVQLSLDDVCNVIENLFPNTERSQCFYRLPKYNASSTAEITTKEALGIAEDLEVLYMDNRTGVELTNTQLKQEEDSFYKGGTLSWAWWYKVPPGHVDIERDVFPEIKKFIIEKRIKTFEAGTITICHKPGSGGTTLAQRILWDLKDKVPCAQVKMNTGSSADNIIESIALLCDKTNLPVILLMDGEEEHRVEALQKLAVDRCCLIVVYVKRCSHEQTDEKEHGKKDTAKFWLPGDISDKESDILELKYGNNIKDPTTWNSVEKMLADIRQGTRRSLFEFGIEIHSHNYKGLESYVDGFLQLQDTSESNLEPFQNVLGMLSLVYYYGQATVPCHFFSSMINPERDHKVLRFTDFPEQIRGLVVKDNVYGRLQGVRICHILVAKEILDQILIKSRKRLARVPSPFICKTAKENLASFANCFIRYAGNGSYGKSHLIKRVVTRTFISRDNKPFGENELNNPKTRKPKLSAILEDVTNRAPYTERFDVLKQLTDSFPGEPQYLAHLGRLYTICLPEEHIKAEKCFVSALDICLEQTSGKKLDEITHNMKLTYMHIYHMYGSMLLAWVSNYAPRDPKDKPKKSHQEGEFQHIASQLLEHTKKACELFEKCREFTPAGYEQSFTYIGEIQIRLMLCNFIKEHGGFKSIHEYMEKNKDAFQEFLEESCEKLDELFIDCLSMIDPDRMDNSIVTYNELYSVLFKNTRSCAVIQRRYGHEPENMLTRRLRIAVLKMSYNGKNAGILESVTRTEDIEFIVQQYESNFADTNQHILTKRQHDIDYREWLFAIRHRRYSKERLLCEVLQLVQRWYDVHKTPYARFYLFILTSLVGFGDGKYLQRNKEVLLQSQQLKDEVTKFARFMTKPKYPTEWLGCADSTIRRLVPGKRFFGLFEYPDDDMPLEKMIGTIRPPNNRLTSGCIDLDLGPDIQVSVKVFFVPARSEMKGSRNKNARVEFHLGFSMSHGYEAFNVQPLKNVECEKCDRKLEYRSCDDKIVCSHCKNLITL